MKQKPIRGTYAFSALSQACVILERRGLWAAIRFIVARSMVGVFNFIWKARRVWHWAWSPLVPEEERLARDAVCEACKLREIKEAPTGFFRWAILGYDLFPGGAYCGTCGCWDWFLSLLKRKNRREGHICPEGKHPGQTPRPRPMATQVPKRKCTCGGGNGTQRQPVLEHTELPSVSPNAMGQHEDIGPLPREADTLPVTLS